MAAARRTKKDPAAAVTPQALERVALAYLDRFDTSERNLRRVLGRALRRAERHVPAAELERAQAFIDELLARYRASGLLDDGRYAESIAQSLRQRGSSRRAIHHKLRARGVGGDVIDAALGETDRDSNDAELEAARAMARRRRLGPHRPPEQRAERRNRDLGVLARAGFSLEVACRALETEPAEPED